MILSVDLASRFSAVVVMSRDLKVHTEFDSWGKTVFEFVDEVVDTATDYDVEFIILEDVPFGISSQAQVKSPFRLQGMLMKALGQEELLERTVFLSPSTWQRHFPGVWKGGAEGARVAASALGYTAPDMLSIHSDEVPPTGQGPEVAKMRSKIRAQLKKASTDYVDAFLIGAWASGYESLEELVSAKGVQLPFI